MRAPGGLAVAAVRGRYPQLSFVITPAAAAPCCQQLVGQAFSGRQDDTLDVVGSSDFGSDLRFTRATAPSGC